MLACRGEIGSGLLLNPYKSWMDIESAQISSVSFQKQVCVPLPVVEVHVAQAAPEARWYLWVYGFSGKVRNTMIVSLGNFQIAWIYIIGGQR